MNRPKKYSNAGTAGSGTSGGKIIAGALGSQGIGEGDIPDVSVMTPQGPSQTGEPLRPYLQAIASNGWFKGNQRVAAKQFNNQQTVGTFDFERDLAAKQMMAKQSQDWHVQNANTEYQNRLKEIDIAHNNGILTLDHADKLRQDAEREMYRNVGHATANGNVYGSQLGFNNDSIDNVLSDKEAEAKGRQQVFNRKREENQFYSAETQPKIAALTSPAGNAAAQKDVFTKFDTGIANLDAIKEKTLGDAQQRLYNADDRTLDTERKRLTNLTLDNSNTEFNAPLASWKRNVIPFSLTPERVAGPNPLNFPIGTDISATPSMHNPATSVIDKNAPGGFRQIPAFATPARAVIEQPTGINAFSSSRARTGVPSMMNSLAQPVQPISQPMLPNVGPQIVNPLGASDEPQLTPPVSFNAPNFRESLGRVVPTPNVNVEGWKPVNKNPGLPTNFLKRESMPIGSPAINPQQLTPEMIAIMRRFGMLL